MSLLLVPPYMVDTGMWECLVQSCDPGWGIGTPQDAIDHYLTAHDPKEVA